MDNATIEVRLVDGDYVSFSYSTLSAFRQAPDPAAYIEAMVEECKQRIRAMKLVEQYREAQ